MKKKSPSGGKKRGASPARSVLGVSVVYRFLRRSETVFVGDGQMGLRRIAPWLESGLTGGDSDG
jgi:hypothetical protein